MESCWFSEQTMALNKVFPLLYPASARYFKIAGLKSDCGYKMVFSWIKFYGFYSRVKCVTCRRKIGMRIRASILNLVFLIKSWVLLETRLYVHSPKRVSAFMCITQFILLIFEKEKHATIHRIELRAEH